MRKAAHVPFQEMQAQRLTNWRFHDPQQRTNTGVVQTDSQIVSHGLYNHKELNSGSLAMKRKV